MFRVWYQDSATGIKAGRQGNGKLFFYAGQKGGYALPDTPQNRIRLERDFMNRTEQPIEYCDSWEQAYATS